MISCVVCNKYQRRVRIVIWFALVYLKKFILTELEPSKIVSCHWLSLRCQIWSWFFCSLDSAEKITTIFGANFCRASKWTLYKSQSAVEWSQRLNESLLSLRLLMPDTNILQLIHFFLLFDLVLVYAIDWYLMLNICLTRIVFWTIKQKLFDKRNC